MGQIEWAIWANEQAIISAVTLFMGAVVGVAGRFNNWEFAAYAIPVSILLFLLEYPRSKRIKGSTLERRFQHLLVPVIDKMGPVSKNYYVRFVIHLLISIPCCFLLPTILGGMCHIITSLIYLVAALKGEEWRPTERPKKQPRGTPAPQPPNRPPPRIPLRRDATREEWEMEDRTSGSPAENNRV